MIQGNLKNFCCRKRRLEQMAVDTGAGGSSQDDVDIDSEAGDESTLEDDQDHATPPHPHQRPQSLSPQLMRMRSNLLPPLLQ